jgi:hypothetical protein
MPVKKSMRENGWPSSLREFFTGIDPFRDAEVAIIEVGRRLAY